MWEPISLWVLTEIVAARKGKKFVRAIAPFHQLMLQFPLYLSFKYSRFKFQAIFNFWYSIIQVATERYFQFCFKVKSIGWKKLFVDIHDQAIWWNASSLFPNRESSLILGVEEQTSNSHDLNVVTNVGNIKKDFDVNHHHQRISKSSWRKFKLKCSF